MHDNWPTTLLEPNVFPHPVSELSLIETHISWVILTGEFAYKIKKPVNLDFLDFSTLEKRAYFCDRELQLNRRFSPNLYLDRVSIAKTDEEKFFVDHKGTGEVVDYAVKMRQFDNNLLLDNIAKQGKLTNDLIRLTAQEIASTHNRLPSYSIVDSATEEIGTPMALMRAMQQNFEQIAEYSLSTSIEHRLVFLQEWQSQRFDSLEPTMKLRLEDGQVKDCHGDCHLGNIVFLDGKIQLFDCIEFNDAFRVMDTIAEVAFLSMDLMARGLHQQSQQFISDYLEYRDDFSGLQLLNLYRSYFAVVRAKVNLMQTANDSDLTETNRSYQQFLEYLDLAEVFTKPNQPKLVMMHGLSGSGKSYAASAIASAIGAIRIRSDVERKRLFNIAPEEQGEKIAGLYSKQVSQQTFERLLELTQTVIACGFSCVVDATFISGSTRKKFLTWAKQNHIAANIVCCEAPESTIRERLENRSQSKTDASDADFEIYQQQKQNAEPLNDEEKQLGILVNTEDCRELQDAITQLQDAL